MMTERNFTIEYCFLAFLFFIGLALLAVGASASNYTLPATVTVGFSSINFFDANNNVTVNLTGLPTTVNFNLSHEGTAIIVNQSNTFVVLNSTSVYYNNTVFTTSNNYSNTVIYNYSTSLVQNCTTVVNLTNSYSTSVLNYSVDTAVLLNKLDGLTVSTNLSCASKTEIDDLLKSRSVNDRELYKTDVQSLLEPCSDCPVQLDSCRQQSMNNQANISSYIEQLNSKDERIIYLAEQNKIMTGFLIGAIGLVLLMLLTAFSVWDKVFKRKNYTSE